MPPESSNTILSEEEIEAALAELGADVEKTESIPSLDDGSGDTPPPPPPPKPVKPPVETVEPEVEKPPRDWREVLLSGVFFWRHWSEWFPDQPWWAPFYTLADTALDLMNRPFRWMNGKSKDLLGVAAVVTIVMSLGMYAAAKLFLMPETAVDFVQEKSAEVLMGGAPEEG